MSAPAAPAAPPDPFDGRYTLVRELGVGGVGRVWEAAHAHTGRRVALKTLREEFAAEPRWMQRFLREARAVARIRHPNVVEVLDMRAGDVPFIVYELLEGEGLDARLAASPDGCLPVGDALRALVPVAAALAAAHGEGIVHRDLKPSNVFLARDARGDEVPKVIDFGLAKHALDDISVTTSDMVLGTPAYMAPEQARAEPDVDAQADVWSFGATLFECLTGALPVDGPNATVVLRRLAREEVRSLRAVAPDLDADVAAVVDRCLVPDRALRFGTMREVVDALTATDAWRREGLGPPVLSCTRVERSLRVAAPAPAVVSSTRPASHRPARSRASLALALGAVAVLAALAGAALTRWRLGDAPPPRAPPPAPMPMPAVAAAAALPGPVAASAPPAPAAPFVQRRPPPRPPPARPRAADAGPAPLGPAALPLQPPPPPPPADPLEPDRRYP